MASFIVRACPAGVLPAGKAKGLTYRCDGALASACQYVFITISWCPVVAVAVGFCEQDEEMGLLFNFPSVKVVIVCDVDGGEEMAPSCPVGVSRPKSLFLNPLGAVQCAMKCESISDNSCGRGETLKVSGICLSCCRAPEICKNKHPQRVYCSLRATGCANSCVQPS